jgi:hypothetical protein
MRLAGRQPLPARKQREERKIQNKEAGFRIKSLTLKGDSMVEESMGSKSVEQNYQGGQSHKGL